MNIHSLETQDDFAVLAGSAAHALNNVLAVLFAATSYLEDDEPSPKAIGRARNAVNSACATGEALSAGLALLALGSQGLTALAKTYSGANACRYDAGDLAELANALQSTVGIDANALSTLPHGLLTWLDRDSLRALLVSAGVMMRRRFGKNLQIDFSALAGVDPITPELTFEFRPVLEPGAQIPILRPGDHPCAIAMQQIAVPMRAMGNKLDFGESGEIRIRLIAVSPG